ncbi:bifunctional glycosyltransferase/CDP-glycerol:glycerophosphate glycerophosphotransferase [Streptosporangium carneum]|uniref:bifunctional glycosyltransferase/CDP-glycerol:glycerophosphate glycerophosphotransferase n=1 Tax=Streptosporangium carneum TaxID=47481 RepID=UPI0022F303C2|nr:bifunctional glycosyltransferase/CDP-glycerol:glycerophosphate glycerophosphotransferase [Streptosporangium carneum]
MIVPIYDVEPYLEACLESLACQTWRDIEVVMVDDGSPDASAEIAAGFAERDGRFVLVSQANAGLGAARNAGLRAASGEFLAFVDSDDMLPPYALETMAVTLAETGSDLVTGNVHRFNGRGAWQSNMHREVFAERAARTHVTRREILLRDRLVTNKLWRRSFWEKHAFDFPEGVLYEDTSVALPAHFLAAAVDVLACPIYLWRERDGDSLSITQDRTHVKGIEDRFASVMSVRRFLLGNGRAAHVPAWDLTVLDGDLPVFLPALERAGEAFRERFLDLARDYLDAVDPRVFARLPAPKRVRWQLVRERRLPELLEFMEWERTVPPEARVVRRLRRHHLAAPVPLRPRTTRLSRELEPRQRIDDVRWEGGRLSVQGRVTLRYLSPQERRHQFVFAWFVREDTGRGIRVPVTAFRTVSLVSRDSEDWCGFRFAVDVDRLGEEEATWRVDLWVVHRGLLRRERLSRPDRSGDEPLEHHRSQRGVRVWPHWTEAGEFRVRVERERARATACTPDGDRLLLSGRVLEDLGPDPVLLVSRSEGGIVHRYPISVSGEGFRVAVDLEGPLSSRLPVLPASSPEAGILDTTAEWRFEVEGAGPVGAGAECRHVHAGRDLAVGASASGALVLREHASAFHVQRAEWTGEGDLELTGTAVGEGPAHLVVTSRNRSDEHLFPLRLSGGRFTVTVTPREVASLAGRLPLPSGTYGMAVRSEGRARRIVSALDAPVAHESPRRRLVLETGPDRLPTLTVGGDLRGEAQDLKTRRALRDRLYPRTRVEEPLREAVFFDSHGGRQFSGDPRAVYEELRRRGTELEFLWHVRDGQVALPEVVAPVPTSVREHFDALATCRYVVTNTYLPKWFRRREGQVVVQTWPGATPKRVGFDVDRGPLDDPAHRERLAGEVGQWSHLVSPGPWWTRVLRDAFRFEGEVLETGSPRDDVLARPGPVAAIRERVGLPEGKKVVLYAPTWRDDRYHGRGRARFDLRLDLHRMWTRLGADHVVMVRRHPNTFDRVPRVGADFVFDVSAYPDIQDLYLVADVLVTDYSSAMFDFAVTGRPILLYAYDLESYRDEVRGFSFDLEARAPGPLLRTTGEVAEAIRDLDRVVAENAARYRDFTADLRPPADGGAAARVVDRVFGHRAGIDIPRQSRKAIHDHPR